jgi:5-oxopent-3-ene-1,2,5-tricarboxylate decarboxylase/2-hydroxyhepta-2,4-diene-1,7-dioate isomerase
MSAMTDTPTAQLEPYRPQGTVYGTLLNDPVERQFWAERMTQAPYQAPPIAPVLYVKTANTFAPCLNSIDGNNGSGSATTALPPDVPQVAVGATLGVVMGHDALGVTGVAGLALFNDLCVPHSHLPQGYYRPPVRFHNRDGFLGIGPHLRPWPTLGTWQTLHDLHLTVAINGHIVQTLSFANLHRDAPTLLAAVGEFMTLRAGDVLLLGTQVWPQGHAHAGERPLARVGDTVTLSAPGWTPLIHRFVSAQP